MAFTFTGTRGLYYQMLQVLLVPGGFNKKFLNVLESATTTKSKRVYIWFLQGALCKIIAIGNNDPTSYCIDQTGTFRHTHTPTPTLPPEVEKVE